MAVIVASNVPSAAPTKDKACRIVKNDLLLSTAERDYDQNPRHYLVQLTHERENG